MRELAALILSLCLLSGCGDREGPPSGTAGSPPPASAPAVSAPLPTGQQEALSLRIVDGAEEGDLLLADLEGSGVYRLSVPEDVPLTVDGAEAAPTALADGMTLTVTFDGMVQESWPAGFGQVYALDASSPAGGSYTDLCGFYLKVLDDLWNVDTGLNGTQAAIDLSQAPGGLIQGEQAAIALRFGELHGVEAWNATYEELLEGGYITAEPLGEGARSGAAFYRWEDGCLLTISPHETEEGEAWSLPVLRFDADKWASSLGAYSFYDCTAVWPEAGTWSGYQVGSEMIS